MTAPRLFTLEQAERTLPLVQRIVQDLVETYPEWRAGVARYEALSLAADPELGEPEEMVAVRTQVAELAERIDGYLRELEGIGCMFKGFDAGLVDFHSLRDDRPMFLCWRLGEDRITHWHEVDAGFEGRQPIDDAVLTESR
ncbi:MAG TPA: DUF2203 domain-containing protein [Gemmatimonadales bacterium]|nr:DUF2203 domain-containing protein [Gemmatimonadales bacterium]